MMMNLTRTRNNNKKTLNIKFLPKIDFLAAIIFKFFLTFDDQPLRNQWAAAAVG